MVDVIRVIGFISMMLGGFSFLVAMATTDLLTNIIAFTAFLILGISGLFMAVGGGYTSVNTERRVD